MPKNRKAVREEDLETMKVYAQRLALEPNADRRMSMQLQFVNMMGHRYGHEQATKMLTRVWVIAKSGKVVHV